MLPGPGLTRGKDCLPWRKLSGGSQKTGPSLGVQNGLGGDWVTRFLGPTALGWGSCPTGTHSGRGACTWVRGCASPTPGKWLAQEWRLGPPEACTGGLSLSPWSKSKEAAEPLGWAVRSWV